MDDIIKQLCNAGELVELYTNRDDYDKFRVGYIIACTDNEYLVHEFDDNNLDDGYYVMHNDATYIIQHHTLYLKNMLQFIKSKPIKYDLPKGYWPELDLYHVVLNLCQQERLMAVVRLHNGFEGIGWVKSFNDEVVEIDRVDAYGEPDGITYLRMEDIKLASFSGLEEKRRTKLYAKRRQ